MAWGKSEEEKAAERQHKEAEKRFKAQQKEQQRQAQEAAAARQAFLESPVGRATAAKAAGQAFFEIELAISELIAPGLFQFGSKHHAVGGRSDALGAIEAVGWRLVHIGYVYRQTSSVAFEGFNDRVRTDYAGVTRGIYLFRNPDADPAESRPLH